LTVQVDSVAMSEETTQPDSRKVRITFEDNGRGIPETDIDRIFDPFFSTKAAGSGTGLGLFVTNDIVQAHGGSIEVASEAGRFTRFTILLPAAPYHAPDHESQR